MFVAAHDSVGGAARAVWRIYESIQRFHSDRVDIFLRVVHKTREDHHILGGRPQQSRWEYLRYFIRTRFRKYFPRSPFVTDNPILHSQALYSTGLGRELNRLDPDVVMLGWLGSATLSIREIGKLKAPVVWRLSDMWMFSGAEHYSPDHRYRSGYSRGSRPPAEEGPDINRETFMRKKRHWKKPRSVISPSSWMARQVGMSSLTESWPVHVIPNPIDTSFWTPQPRQVAREGLGLPENAIVVCFGAGGGTANHHKGGDIFLDILPIVREKLRSVGVTREVVGVIFGEEQADQTSSGVSITFLGQLGDSGLRDAYSAADVFVVPSRMDNLPSTAVEAQACGCPVAAFDVAGLADIVLDEITGKLAPAGNEQALAEAVFWTVGNESRRKQLGQRARERAIEDWSPEVIAGQYLDVLDDASRGK